MLLENINIEKKLHDFKIKNSNENSILEEVKSILLTADYTRQEITSRLESTGQIDSNQFVFDLLESQRIYHLSSIKGICIDYRLRFLESSLFKNNIPEEVISKIKNLEKLHNTKLEGFKIMAPSKLFKLKNADDPLLFAPIGNDYFYLIHKWGNDMSPLRKMFVLPLKSMSNATITIILVSLMTTLILPITKLGTTSITLVKIISFLFIFKSYFAIFLYYAFWKGKNFNSQIWDTKFYN